MASRTYLIGLYYALKAAHKYATQYLPQMSTFMTPTQAECLTATINALAECLPLFIPAAPPH